MVVQYVFWARCQIKLNFLLLLIPFLFSESKMRKIIRFDIFHNFIYLIIEDSGPTKLHFNIIVTQYFFSTVAT